MLSPKRTKYRKKMRGRMRGNASRGNKISYGDFGLMSLDHKWITNRQIEAARVAITRHIKRVGKVWIRIFPDIPYTKKPAETRMGKGKGNPEYWVAAVYPGTIMFEVGGVSQELVESAMKLASSKLPIKTKMIVRRDYEA